MKPFLFALAFVLFGSVAPLDAMAGNPLAEGAAVADRDLAQVRGSGPSAPFAIKPYEQAFWIRFEMNRECNCHSPRLAP